MVAQRPVLDTIDGLRWRRNWRLPNGGRSYVVPFPTRRSFNIVFHGSARFAYGHFGVHLGQEDRLTFLGSPNQQITASFVDLRQDSATRGARLTVCFAPTSEFELRIPPGVAHDFEGLENIDTINNYAVFLPDPDDWTAGKSSWRMDSDIVNVTKDEAQSGSAPFFQTNVLEASDTFYRLLAERQTTRMEGLSHAHPYTIDVSDGSGVRRTVKISEQARQSATAGSEAIDPIAGLMWTNHAFVETGDASGIRPLGNRRPYYLVDHGIEPYAHDAFGIHLGQDDHLTFMGRADADVMVEFVDCRRGSATLHQRVELRFAPSAVRTLVIPRGVAHRFAGLENVTTLNQGIAYLDDDGDYQPGNDVIDWPLSRDHFPVLTVNSTLAGDGFYDALVEGQRRLRASGHAAPTPIVLMVPDAQGNQVRVAIRRDAGEGAM